MWEGVIIMLPAHVDLKMLLSAATLCRLRVPQRGRILLVLLSALPGKDSAAQR